MERGHRYGLVTSAGIIAVGNALEDAVVRSRALPALDLGLHFVLLNKAGQAMGLRQVAQTWLRGEFGSREAAGALRQQLDLLQRVHRLSLSHIALDSPLSAFPPLIRVVSAVAMEYNIPGIRLPKDKSAFLGPSLRLSRRILLTYGRRTTEELSDVQGQLTPIGLSSLLRHTTASTQEIVCRPGVGTPIVYQTLVREGDWERDLQAVCDSAAHACVRSGHVRLATWRDL